MCRKINYCNAGFNCKLGVANYMATPFLKWPNTYNIDENKNGKTEKFIIKLICHGDNFQSHTFSL